jgi:AcrR family transcriptional regulator
MLVLLCLNPMPKIVDRDQYRKELLSKSFELFAQKGYSSITMRQIAEALGVSTGTLYHYFPSKEAIFLQLVEEQTEQDILNFLAEASGIKTLSERIEAIVQFVAKYEDYFFKQNVIYIDFYQQHGHRNITHNEILKKSWEDTRVAIANYLEIPDLEIADFILTFIYGLIMERLYACERVSFERQGTILKKMLLAYLGES